MSVERKDSRKRNFAKTKEKRILQNDQMVWMAEWMDGCIHTKGHRCTALQRLASSSSSSYFLVLLVLKKDRGENTEKANTK